MHGLILGSVNSLQLPEATRARSESRCRCRGLWTSNGVRRCATTQRPITWGATNGARQVVAGERARVSGRIAASAMTEAPGKRFIDA
eukprot:6177847-Pleurochrysis_carterae.AAC.2